MSIPLRAGVAILAIACAPYVEAQFGPGLQVTNGSGGYTPPEMVRLAADVIGIATTSGGTIYHTSGANGFPPASPQLVDPLPQTGIHLAAGSILLQFLAYERQDGSGGPGERDIRVASNGSGPFALPETITTNNFDDRDPAVRISTIGERHIAWVAEAAPGSPFVRWKRDGAPDLALGAGEAPQIVDGTGGEVIVAYQRAGNLFLRRITASGPDVELPLLSVPGGVTSWRLHGTTGGALHLAAVVGGALTVRSGTIAGLGPPVTIAPGPIDGAPCIDTDLLGRVVVVHASGGQILWTRSSAGVYPPSVSIGAPAGSSAPALSIDSLGYIHISHLQGGEVWYRNDVPPPAAGFVVQGGTGLLPLPVSFQDGSSGVITSRLWDFGDGASSAAIAPQHTYTEPGIYDVSLTVTGPGGEDTMTHFGAVVANLPANVMEIADIIAFSGQPILQPILATHPEPLQGFQVALTYDFGVTPISTVNFAGTQVSTLGNGNCTPGSVGPEFLVVNNFPGGVNSYLIIAVIFDWSCPPFDGAVLTPGIEQTIGNLVYTVPFSLPLGTRGDLAFTSGVGNPPIANSFAVQGGTTTTPYTLDGSCTVFAQPQFLFKRGDANYCDQVVDIADAIFILAYLFSGGASPTCPDSADANDDGAINIGDAIYDLAFLFASGATLPYPFPGAGLDPTPDSLPICNPSCP